MLNISKSSIPSFIRWTEKGRLQIEQIGAAAAVEARDEALGPGPAGVIEAASPVGRLLMPQVISHVRGGWNLSSMYNYRNCVKRGSKHVEKTTAGEPLQKTHGFDPEAPSSLKMVAWDLRPFSSPQVEELETGKRTVRMDIHFHLQKEML